MKRIPWIILGCLGLLITVQAASFDCSKAEGQVDKIICSSEKLSILDDKLGDAYAKAVTRVLDVNSLNIEQRNWLKVRNIECTNEKCLVNAYEIRIRALLEESAPPITKYMVINKKLGKFRVEIKTTGYQGSQYSIYNKFRSYALLIFDQDGKQLQIINVDTTVSQDQLLSIIDMDGDGYTDLSVTIGYGAGPFPFTELYRYIKATNLFEKDKSFPGETATPSEHKGCVYTQERVSLGDAVYDYRMTEWCLSQDTGEWSAGTSCSLSDDNECFSRIDDYLRGWVAHHQGE